MCIIQSEFKLLSLQYSWKLLHPVDKYANPECPETAEEYERVSIKFARHITAITAHVNQLSLNGI